MEYIVPEGFVHILKKLMLPFKARNQRQYVRGMTEA
jgi:hypothetical protein